MILISKTFDYVTDESAAQGESAERGFEFQDVAYSFKELVELIQDGFTNPSCQPATGATYEWLNTNSEYDHSYAQYETYSLHYSNTNPPRKAKYWRKAFIAAGIIKG